MDMGLDLWTMMVGGLGAIAGAAARAYGERLRAIEKRDVSERDLWLHIGGLEQKMEESRKESAALRTEIAVLRRENEQLRAQHEALSERYDRLRESYDTLLRQGSSPPGGSTTPPPEGPREGPSPVPGGAS